MKFGLLRVTTADGQSREFPLDLPSLIVGRGAGNGITLDDLSVSRRHARLTVDSGHLFVEDLGSAAGTFIGAQRLEPNTRYLVERIQDLRFGEVSAAFQPPVAGSADAITAARPDSSLEAGSPGMPATLRASLEAPGEPIEPGGTPGMATLTVSNRGRIVDDIALQLSGLPAAWVRMSIERFPLLPGADMTVTITIQPPRSPEARSGAYDFSVSVVSGETGREIVAAGSVRVLPFSGTSLSLQPVRSEGAFTLLAENAGNTSAAYALSGVDDEQAFQYEFERAALDLDPGERESLKFRVKPQTKKWFGKQSVAPFKVVATPSDGSDVRPSVDGQLAIAPPLEKMRRILPLALLALIAAIAALALLFMSRDGGGTKTASAEEPYAGVTMCDKKDKKTPPTIQTAAAAPGGGSGAPFFAQNDPAWATEEYAKAKDPEFGPDWCGSTLAQCGCATTSVATIMALFEIVTLPDGSELTPKTLNGWLNGQATKTNRGWVSQGYIYGDVIWTAVNQLSAEIAAKRPGTRTLRFAGMGTGSDDEVRSELRAGRPVILAVPGHYVAAVGLDGDKILINDPFFRDRKTLDAYAGKVLNSVKFEPSADVSAVVVSAPSDVRLRVTDKEGRVVGSLNAGTPEEAEKAAQRGIPGASYDLKAAFRDPNCIESPPPPGAGLNQISLPGRPEDYKIEALSANGGAAQFTVHSYDTKGNVSIKTQTSDGPLVADLKYDPTDTSGAEVAPRPGASPTLERAGNSPAAGPSRTPLTPSPSPGGSPSSSPSATGTTPVPTGTTPGGATPTATATGTAAPTTPPLVPPQGVNLACNTAVTQNPKNATVSCTAQIQGAFTTTRWSVNGVTAPGGGGQTAFSTNFTSDTTATIEVSACNVTLCTSASRQVTVSFAGGGGTSTTAPPPPPSGTTPAGGGAPQNVGMVCNVSVESWTGVVSCMVSATTPFSTVQWSAGGGQPGSGLSDTSFFSTQRTTSGTVTISASACNGGACASAPPASVYVDLRQDVSMFSESWSSACTNESPFIGVVFGTGEGPSATGTVTFRAGGTTLATVPAESGEGLPSFYWQPPHPAGTQTIVMQYSGDANYKPASITHDITFSECTAPEPTNTALNMSPGSPGPGDSVTLTATITPSSGEPFGLVSFYDDGGNIGSAFPTAGVAQLSYAIPGGTHSFSAVHEGSSTSQSSTSNTLTVVVPLANSSVVLSLPNGSTINENGCAEALVTVTPAFATGTVNIWLWGSESGALASGSLSGGQASLYVCGWSGFYPSPPGTYSIYATYEGDAGTNGSQSEQVSLTIKAIPEIAINLTGSGCNGEPIAALVIRSGGGSPQPTGTVTFDVYGPQNFQISATIVNGIAQTSILEIPPGTYDVFATYAGDSLFIENSAYASLTFVNCYY